MFIYKVFVLFIFVLLIISLFTSLHSVYKEKGEGRRTLVMLSIRVSLAVLLVLSVAFGIAKGYISPHAPWEHRSFHHTP